MKTKLPLPKEEKQILVSKEVVQKLGYPFSNADLFCKVSFTKSDTDYIENKIKAHNLFKTIQRNDKFTVRSMLTMIQFYKTFINDKNCPNNLRSFLGTYVDELYRGIQNIKAEKDAAQMNFMVNRWMELCR